MAHELLVLVPGEDAPRRFEAAVLLGRGPENDLVLDQAGVSARHCELRPLEGGWEVIDLGSTNGTFVDGRPVTTALLGARATLRLGAVGPVLRLSIPALPRGGSTREFRPLEVVERWFGADAPDDMSPHTATMRAAVQARRQADASGWRQRLRRYRVALGALALVALGTGAAAVVQARRVAALRRAAAAVFGTIKAVELDVLRLQATAAPDPALAEKRARLARQYDDLVRTLGVYGPRTPRDERLIYRAIHRLGESEATVPRAFLRQLRTAIRGWREADLRTAFARARALGLAPAIVPILRRHHLPREFLFLALQESRFDPRAVGPETPVGIPKGLWQLTPPTARAYGLRLGPLGGERAYDPGDERHDVARASEAAARYLEDLYRTDAQLSGLLVVGSYNLGETRMRRLIRALPESPAERNLWTLLERHRADIPAETYDYMFRVLAAAIIGTDPRAFGFDLAPLVDAGEGPTPSGPPP